MQVWPVLGLVLLIALVLFLSEWAGRRGIIPLVLARKAVHLVAVSAIAIAPIFFQQPWWLDAIVAASTGLLFWAVARGRLAIDEARQRRSWGIALFPISFLLLHVLFGSLWPWLVVYPMLVLALADPAAALVGELTARRFYYLTGDRKSWHGSLTFFVVAAAVLLLLPGVLRHLHPGLAWPFISLQHALTVWAVLAVAAIATLAEALGSGGTDNLTVPLLTAWGMAAVVDSALQTQLWPAVALATAVALLAWWRKWLDAGGAATALLLGVLVWVAQGWQVALPLLLFFVSGSLLSRLGASAGPADAKQGRARDWQQVLANGGLAGLLMWLHTFFPSPAWVLAAWASVAVCLADTWSSEIGQRAGGRVVDILRWRAVPAGLSGGISWQGTLAGVAGATLLAVIAVPVLAIGWQQAAWLAVAGVAGMLLDSVLGSLLQAKYRQPDGSWSDRPARAGQQPDRGWRWMTNDAVNLLSNLIIVLAWLLW